MFAGLAIGAGTGAVAGHMAGGGCSTASTRRSRLRVVFAGIRVRCVTGRERQVPRLALPTEIGRTLFESGPFWICDSRGLVFGAE
jgi:L-aminopeptidase/D-esterase-like protein